MMNHFSRNVLLVLCCCLNIEAYKRIKCSDIQTTDEGYHQFTLEIPLSYDTDVISTRVLVSGPQEGESSTILSLIEEGFDLHPSLVEVHYVLTYDSSFLQPHIIGIEVVIVDQCIYCKRGQDYRPNMVYYNVSHTFKLIGTPNAPSPNCANSKHVLNPLPENCGVTNFRRPIRGRMVERRTWPWLVPIFIRMNLSMRFVCGASIIGSRTILTAAHCLINQDDSQYHPRNVIVFTGRHNLSNFNEAGYRSHIAEQIVVHPEYVGTHQHDIALINLANEIEFTPYAKPVCLWSDTAPVDEQIGGLAGWGIKDDGLPSREPYFVEPVIVRQDVCKNSSNVYSRQNLSSTLCAGNLDGIGPCRGDSGGGLILSVNGEKYSLRGLVSMMQDETGARECNTRKYVLYTDVAKYYSWIISEMW